MGRRSLFCHGLHASVIAAGLPLASLLVLGTAATAAPPALSIAPPDARCAGPGTSLELVWTITNPRDAAVRIRLESAPARAWPWPPAVETEVPANGVVRFLRDAAVPDTARAGEVAIVARLVGAAEGQLLDSCAVAVTVLDAPPAAIALENAPDLVRLEWRTPMWTGGLGLVERSREGGSWIPVGGDHADESGRCVFDDRDVTPGGTLCYRLREWVNGMTMVSAVTTVLVPEFRPLRVAGLSPNPSRGTPAVSFTLPERAATRLEVLDAGGRRVWSRELGVLAPGPHRYVLDAHGSLHPGLYVFRVVQGRRSAGTSGVIVR